MHTPATPPPTRIPTTEAGGLTLFLLFFGSLLGAGLIGVWLWNSNPSAKEGRAFGTANQIGQLPQAAPAGSDGAAGGGAGALVSQGQQLAQSLGCTACHTTTGQSLVGPTWKGLAGSQRQLADGQTVAVDDAYLRESILSPDARIARGFQPGMMAPAVAANKAQLESGDTVDALIAYIKSIK